MKKSPLASRHNHQFNGGAHILRRMFRRQGSQVFPEPKPRVAEGRRIYAIGDIHGRVDLLTRVLDGIQENAADAPDLQHTVIFLGDYVDRGPRSADVLHELLETRNKIETVLLKGNHEILLLDFLRDPDTLPAWVAAGGLPTLASYGLSPSFRPTSEEARVLREQLLDKMPETHLAMLQSLSSAYAADDYFFVHAGVRPGAALADQAEADLLWIREEFLEHRGMFEKRIVHGHTPVKAPDVRVNRINIDTGAFATGQLTCLVLESDNVRFLQT